MNIPIFEALWLYNGGCISGFGQTSEVIQQSRIHSLIDHEHNNWNYNLIAYYFDDAVVQEILKTPLISQVVEDQLILILEKNGHYSVRSVYRSYCGQFVSSLSWQRV